MDKILALIWGLAFLAILALCWLFFASVHWLCVKSSSPGFFSDDTSVDANAVRVLWQQELRRSLGAPGVSEQQQLLALGDADGQVAFWHLDQAPAASNSFSQFKLSSDSIVAAPIPLDAELWAVGDEGGTMHAFDASGQVAWKFAATGPIKGAATVWQELVIFGSYDQTLYALDRRTGQERWRCQTEGYIHGQAVLAPEQGWLFFGNCDGQLQKLSAADGQVLASLEFDSPIPETPTLSQGLCLVLTHGGELIAVDQETMREKWRASTDDHYVSSPVMIGETIFLTTSAGLLHAYQHANDNWQRDLTTGVPVVPVTCGGSWPAYTVSTNGRIVQLLDNWPPKVNFLLDLQRDCNQKLALAGQKAILVTEDGAVIALEMP